MQEDELIKLRKLCFKKDSELQEAKNEIKGLSLGLKKEVEAHGRLKNRFL